jgi:dimethylhistidine N-methyltransferase
MAQTSTFLNSRLQIEYLGNLYKPLNIDEGEDIIRGLNNNPKSLPSHYFYDHKGSLLFEQICELPEYYPTRTETAILAKYGQDIANLTQGCELLELGSGSSTKTRLLLDAYSQLDSPLHYVPIDVSSTILKDSALQLLQDYPNIHIQGKVGTYQQAITHLNPPSLPRRLIFFLGSSLGNFTPQQCDRFFKEISDALRENDFFLLGVDLKKSQDVLELAYNDSQGITAAFNLNILSHLNWRFDANFQLNLFEHKAIFNQNKSQIEMYLKCKKLHNAKLNTLDITVEFETGESILTEISRKFDLESIQQELLVNNLNPIQIFTDSQQWFALILCQPKSQ